MRRDGVIEWYLKVRRTVDTEKGTGVGVELRGDKRKRCWYKLQK